MHPRRLAKHWLENGMPAYAHSADRGILIGGDRGLNSLYQPSSSSNVLASCKSSVSERSPKQFPRSCIRPCARGRFYNVVDFVNRPESEARNGRPGRLPDHLTRMGFVILDELVSAVRPVRRPGELSLGDFTRDPGITSITA
jgi:hypothetical protein